MGQRVLGPDGSFGHPDGPDGKPDPACVVFTLGTPMQDEVEFANQTYRRDPTARPPILIYVLE